jgi:hypothetical protein
MVNNIVINKKFLYLITVYMHFLQPFCLYIRVYMYKIVKHWLTGIFIHIYKI